MEELSPTARLPAEVEAAAQDPHKRFGPFVLVKELGRGGAGVVHLAYDLRLHRRVALKTLLDMSPERFERFSREARAVASLEHPGIVRVVDLAVHGGRPCMAMELIEGCSLRDMFKDGSFRTRELVGILRDVAAGLGHAHAMGIVHRDVKPGNILIDTQGRGKIMDFGVARDASAVKEDLTSTGSALGTPEYMSPEQASDARDVTPRSDVYALGVVLYEGLTGKQPFVGASAYETMFKVMKGNVARPSSVGDVPRELEAIIVKCLERDPMKRYADGTELAAALEGYLIARAAASPSRAKVKAPEKEPAPREGLRWLPIAVVAALAGVAVGGGALAAWHVRDAAEREATRRAEAARAAAEAAARQKEDERRRAEEQKKTFEAGLDAAIATADVTSRAALLDRFVEKQPRNLRARLARATARVLMAEEQGLKNESSVDLESGAREDLDAALEIERGNPAALVEAALLAHDKGDKNSFTELLAKVPQDGSELARFAEMGPRVGPTPAETAALVAACPGIARAWRAHGERLVAAGRTQEGIAALESALALRPYPRIFQQVATLQQGLGDQAALEKTIGRWIAAWPGSLYAHFTRAQLMGARQKYDEAIAEGRKIVELGSDRGYTISVPCLRAKNDFDGVVAEVDEGLARSATPYVRAFLYYYRAEALATKGDLGAAGEDCISGVNEKHAGFNATLSAMAASVAERWLQRGDGEAAQKFLDRFLESPAGPSLEVLRERARVAVALSNLGEAEALQTRAAAFTPDHRPPPMPELDRGRESVNARLAQLEPTEPAVRLDRALVLVIGGYLERARSELDLVIQGSASDLLKARALALRSRWFGNADDMAKAYALAPDDARVLAERAFTDARARNEGPARTAAERALSLGRADAEVHALRGAAWINLDDPEGARAEGAAAIAIDPRSLLGREVMVHADEKKGDDVALAKDLRAYAELQIVPLAVECLKWRAAFVEKKK
ncbi:MAG TPA: protein kinase [Planctomycetota bacterium]|nr:protein kinase [Planctomycetota bacterium]